MFPAVLSEAATYEAAITEMLQGIRNAAHGLTDEQARQRPTRSALSIAGVIKHVTWVMRQTVPDTTRTTEPGSTDGAAEFLGSFTPTEEETLADLLGRFDAAREALLAQVRTSDPAAEYTAGPQPWFSLTESRTATRRTKWADAIGEFARHAGHADIIREQLDGATAAPLLFTVEGLPGNGFIEPWLPAS